MGWSRWLSALLLVIRASAGSCVYSIAGVGTFGLRAALVQLKSSYYVKGIILSDSLLASCEAMTVQRIPYVIGVLLSLSFRNLCLAQTRLACLGTCKGPVPNPNIMAQPCRTTAHAICVHCFSS